jgi:hypothetical protein
MGNDVCALVRRDHDDLDRGLAAMVDAATPPDELTSLLDVFRLALAVHTAAEARVFELLLGRVSSRSLTSAVSQARREHVAQRAAAEALVQVRPGSISWYEHALDLRVAVVEHAGRAEQLRWTFDDHVPLDVLRALASEYATERLRVLSSTSPLRLAERRDTPMQT